MIQVSSCLINPTFNLMCILGSKSWKNGIPKYQCDVSYSSNHYLYVTFDGDSVWTACYQAQLQQSQAASRMLQVGSIAEQPMVKVMCHIYTVSSTLEENVKRSCAQNARWIQYQLKVDGITQASRGSRATLALPFVDYVGIKNDSNPTTTYFAMIVSSA